MANKEHPEYDGIWNTRAIESYVEGRSRFEDVTRKLVNEILAEHLNEGDVALEIGSGLGELVRLAPEFASQIKQTDQSMELVSAHQRRNPDSNISQAHAYDLPFESDSFQSVLGYASFDTIPNLRIAASEMYRVTEAGGSVVHMLDLQASPNTVFFNLKQMGDQRTPFPDCDEHGRDTGVRLLSDEDINRIKSETPPGAHTLIDLYAESPEELSELLVSRPEILTDLARRAKGSAPSAEVINYNQYFTDRFEEALVEAGFKNVQVRRVEASELVDRDGRFDKVPGPTNSITNDTGLELGSNDPTVPEGKIRITKKILVIEAKKPSNTVDDRDPD